MQLSQNIKRLRLERNLTQEQLAERLGVSAQAVSKWETSDTYPDGSLLVPLAEQLGVSLDELFGHDMVSMADLSGKIIRLLHKTEERRRFDVVRDIGWQVEKGLFNCRMEINGRYDPTEIQHLRRSSYILNDYGFTLISNGKEPFFSVFPEPEEGFGDFLNDRDAIQRIFAALSAPDTLRALVALYRHGDMYTFESDVLASECEIAGERMDEVLDDLKTLRIIRQWELNVNGENRVLYASRPNHMVIPLFLFARELAFSKGFCLQSHNRNKPLLGAT